MAGNNVSFPYPTRRNYYQWPGHYGNPADTPRGRAWLVSRRKINNASPYRRKTYRNWYDTHQHGYHDWYHPGWPNLGGGGGGGGITSIGGAVGPNAHTGGTRGGGTRGGGRGGKRTLRAADGKQAPKAARRGGKGGGGGGRGTRGASSSS